MKKTTDAAQCLVMSTRAKAAAADPQAPMQVPESKMFNGGKARCLLTLLGVLVTFGDAHGVEFKWAELSGSLKNRVSVGAAIRTQDRSNDLIGKLNIEGQQDLCAEDDCRSDAGDPEPNQRLVAAAGSFSATDNDNGNLNYDKYDIVAATSKLTTDLNLTWNDFALRARGVAYFDPANVNFKEFHSNTRYQSEYTARSEKAEKHFAKNLELLDLYVQYDFNWHERNGLVSLGQQTVRWGESTLVVLNSLSEINPPNAAYLRMPGADISELFQPVPMALASFDAGSGVSIEALYQLGWRAVQPDPAGSFFSDSDVAGGGEYFMLGIGQYSEDPNSLYEGPGVIGLISSSSRTASLQPDDFGKPAPDGQYGMRVNYFADWLNEGTELGFHFLNYHSRLPYLSTFAAQRSCTRDAMIPGNVVSATLACRGFKGASNPYPGGLEPLPLDTLRPFLEYPENIRMLGLSFNTNMGDWALSGEYSFRDNLPMQLNVIDVIFTGLQPAFPEQDFGLPGLGSVPSAEHAVPAYLPAYRGVEIHAGDRIAGYERMKVGQLDLTGVRAISNSNPLGADQIIIVAELGLTHVIDLPDIRHIQFQGGNVNRTHYSPGADGTGSAGVPDTRRINPTQQVGGEVTDYAWGLRAIARLEYNDGWLGFAWKPLAILEWDVDGVAPFPMQNFVEGNVQIRLGSEIVIHSALTANVQYQWLTGGEHNTRKDRDNLSISMSYLF